MPKGRGASVEIICADSQSLHEIVEIPGGDAERPLSTTSLECKFKKFAIPVIGSAAAEQIVSLVNGLDQLPDRELTRSAKGEGKQNRFWYTAMGAPRGIRPAADWALSLLQCPHSGTAEPAPVTAMGGYCWKSPFFSLILQFHGVGCVCQKRMRGTTSRAIKATWRSRTAFTTAINPICRRELILATFVKLLDFGVFQQYRHGAPERNI
jgi:hypothetical protein